MSKRLNTNYSKWKKKTKLVYIYHHSNDTNKHVSDDNSSKSHGEKNQHIPGWGLNIGTNFR